MPEVTVVNPDEFKIDLIPQNEPALSARSDVPVIETKPDSQPAPETAKAKDAAPDKAVEGKKEVTEESATTEQPEDPAADASPKPAKGVQKRIDELTNNWREAQRLAEAERAEKLRLLALVEQGGKPAPKQEVEADPEPQRPDRAAFTDPEAYANALADYADAKASWSAKNAVQQALAEEGRKRQEEAARQAAVTAQQAYNARVEKAAEKYSDYKAVAESPDVQVSMLVAHAIQVSEHGPDLQYHLGKNPAEAKRISSLHPVQQLIELGKLEAKLTAPAPKEDSPPPPPKPAVSNAPKPIKPLESKSEPVAKDPKDMSMDEYAAYAKDRDAKAAKRSGAHR